MIRVVLTGATGFIGRHLVQHLATLPSVKLLVVVRSREKIQWPALVDVAVLADFRDEKGWQNLLSAGDIVLHLAGLAHRDLPTDAQVEGFFEANVATSRALALAAVRCNIRRLIFISSIGVYGSSREDIVQVNSSLHPDQPYAESKLAAELALLSAPGRRFGCTILRLPLVYGADAPGNFGRLLRLVALGIPLPFAGLTNRKSFLAIDTLNVVIERLLAMPLTGDQTLIVTEPASISLADLLKNLSTGMGKRPKLFYLPHWLLRLLLTAVGQKKMYKKLCLALEADSRELYQLLEWKPSTESASLIRIIGNQYQSRKQ